MSPDKTIEQANLMIRYAESVKHGVPIELQVSSDGKNWNTVSGEPKWTLGSCVYRQKPLERYVLIDSPYTSTAHERKHDAVDAAMKYNGRVVLMREVLNES